MVLMYDKKTAQEIFCEIDRLFPSGFVCGGCRNCEVGAECGYYNSLKAKYGVE